MTVLQALFLGVIQGLTEFLPVSSSGHLVLFRRLLNVDLGGADVVFDLALHIGTLFAVCIAMRRELFALVRSPRRLLYLVLASLPAAAAGVLLEDAVDEAAAGGRYLFAGFAATAALLTAAQIRAAKRRGGLPLRAVHAAVMGLAQAAAIFPGLSRSGATVAAGVLAGADRGEAARFSFLMSIPVIAGGFAIKFFRLAAGGGIAGAIASTRYPGPCIAAGVAAAAFCGLAAVKITLSCALKAKYTPFIIYLCLLACACAWLEFYGFAAG